MASVDNARAALAPEAGVVCLTESPRARGRIPPVSNTSPTSAAAAMAALQARDDVVIGGDRGVRAPMLTLYAVQKGLFRESFRER